MKTELCQSIPVFVVGHTVFSGLLGILRCASIGEIAVAIVFGVALNIAWLWFVLRRDKSRDEASRLPIACVRRRP